MSKLTASRRKARADLPPTEPSDAPAVSHEQALFRLVRALEDLARLARGGAVPPGDAGEGFHGRDEDDEHLYFWLDLPDHRGPDIDINLHGKTLMIRFQKPGRGA